MIISGQLNFLHNPNICDWSELANEAGIELNEKFISSAYSYFTDVLGPMSKYHKASKTEALEGIRSVSEKAILSHKAGRQFILNFIYNKIG